MDSEGGSHGACYAERFAPSVIGILDNWRAAGVDNSGNVSLEVGYVVVQGVVVLYRVGISAGIAEEGKGIASSGHLAQAGAIRKVQYYLVDQPIPSLKVSFRKAYTQSVLDYILLQEDNED